MTATPHPLVARYAQRRGLAHALRADGRATFVIDGKYRVHLSGAPNGWAAIYARLRDLPPDALARERLLTELGKLAAGLLTRHAAACVIDPAAQSLWLQQMVRPDCGEVEMDEAVGQFINALALWSSAARRAA
jgi:hypothetical protein